MGTAQSPRRSSRLVKALSSANLAPDEQTADYESSLFAPQAQSLLNLKLFRFFLLFPLQ